MEEIYELELDYVKDYGYRPIYTCQVNKSGCRLILELDGSVDYRFTENNGESMMLPLNHMLICKGKQKAIVKVYPKKGDEILTKYAHVDLTFYYAEDKDINLKGYKKEVVFKLPEGLEDKKLPYFESVIEFDVNVPYDYTAELDNSKDLKNIKNIEFLIVKKYNSLRELCINFNQVEYARQALHQFGKVSNTMYNNTLDEIKKGYGNGLGLVNPAFKNRVFVEIEGYDIKFYAKNKIVALWQKNLKPIMYMKGEATNNEGETKEIEGGDPIFLYWPKESEGLKIW
ncbi:hypothetical protein [Tenacibaculum ovolyticum]|uniref:hypothetical protein n=1 Tax=Tenacibaculum ovolyticum TaxID=104270 RepID=UPI001F352B49|nr:hypothetical protein [Tenacibaculum ovolyticum]